MRMEGVFSLSRKVQIFYIRFLFFLKEVKGGKEEDQIMGGQEKGRKGWERKESFFSKDISYNVFFRNCV